MKNFKITIKTDVTKLRNQMHFDVQRTTRAAVFKDRTKYDRKRAKRQRLDVQLAKLPAFFMVNLPAKKTEYAAKIMI